MSILKKSFFGAMSLMVSLGLITSALAQTTSTESAHGFDTVRIEDDFNLAYPVGKTEEIVSYLKGKYIDDPEFVKNLGPNFTSSFGDEDFTDTYYDTPGLELYGRKIGLRHRRRVNRLDETNRKNGRELIQLKLSGEDKFTDADNTGSRNELKYDVELATKYESPDDAHPLFSLIDSKQRQELKDRLAELDIDPYDLRPIITIQQRRQRVYVNRDDATFISFSMDDAVSSRWWADVEFSQMELELNELAYTEADAATKERMQAIRQDMIKDLREHFPYLQDDKTIKYTKAFDLFAEKIPLMRFWVKIGWLKGPRPATFIGQEE